MASESTSWVISSYQIPHWWDPADYTGHMFVLELEFDGDQRRLSARPAHRERLLSLHAAGRLVMAGPWEDDSGAMLLFTADRASMDKILAADPYYSSPGVRVKSLRVLKPIVGPLAMGAEA